MGISPRGGRKGAKEGEATLLHAGRGRRELHCLESLGVMWSEGVEEQGGGGVGDQVEAVSYRVAHITRQSGSTKFKHQLIEQGFWINTLRLKEVGKY